MICQVERNYPNFISLSDDLAESVPAQLRDVLSKLDSWPPVYQRYIEDLKKYRSRITPTELSYALVTILAVAVLEKEVDSFINIENDVEREEKMTERVYLRVERAFTKGNSPEEIKRSILQRVDDVKRIYLRAKEQDSLFGFFHDAFVGPPCFNGRLITMLEYEKKQLDLQEDCGGKTDLDYEAIQLEEILYEFPSAEAGKLPNFPEFVQHLMSVAEHRDKWKGQVEKERFMKIFDRACNIFVGGDL